MSRNKISPERPEEILPALTAVPYSAHLREGWYVGPIPTSTDMLDYDGIFTKAGDFFVTKAIEGSEKTVARKVFKPVLGHYQIGEIDDREVAFVSSYRRNPDPWEDPEYLFSDYFYTPEDLDLKSEHGTLIVAAHGLFRYVQGTLSSTESQEIYTRFREIQAEAYMKPGELLELLQKLESQREPEAQI